VTGDTASVDTYIAALPAAAQEEVRSVRARIRAVAPDAIESISYGIPTFSLGGRYLVYVAAWKHHLSLYPVPRSDDALLEDLAPFQAGRGTLRFAYGSEIPEGLVERIVVALIEERSAATG
jgi:uncharacterized protein YdhG (YjbR/CyaY superfamily)